MTDQQAPDYRYVGPVTECPACTCEWLLAPLVLDRESQLPGLIGLDVTCFNCGALCKMATPLDRIHRELEEEWDDVSDVD